MAGAVPSIGPFFLSVWASAPFDTSARQGRFGSCQVSLHKIIAFA